VQLTVRDRGVGMTDEVKAHIFEPFFTTKEVRQGFGLGLATVYGIVKANGGHIEVVSQPGCGSTFTVYLPHAESTAPADEEPTTAPAPRGWETVLLVEDDAVVRKLAQVVLQQCGYVVLQAGDGACALEICGQHHGTIDLLLTDLVMPGLGGRVLAEKLTAQYPGLRVLFMSGYTDDAVIRHGVTEADVAFLQKPFTPAALACKVREVLNGAC
jgi:CheY-like chemotaxis protein